MTELEKEHIRRKKVMQAAGIKVPNTNSSWGPWWEQQWQNAITHKKTNKYYGVPSFTNFIHRTWDQITGNTTYQAEPAPIGGTLKATDMSAGAQVRRTLRNWKYFGDPVRDIAFFAMSGPSKAATTTGTVIKAAPKIIKAVPEIIRATPKVVSKLATKEGAKKAGARVVETVIKEAPRAGTGYLGGETADIVSEAITGKSWAENAADKMSNMAGFHIEPIFGEMTNFGYLGGYKWMDRGIRRASFNHITPISYDDGITPLTKWQEGKKIIKNLPKQLVSFKSIQVPAWRSRLESKLASLDPNGRYNPNGYDIMSSITNKNFLDNREDALRLVFGFKPKTKLYVPNGDGTYRYNLDYVYSQNPRPLHKEGFNVSSDGTVTTRYTYEPHYFDYTSEGIPYKGYGDNLAHNGGGIGYTEKDGMSYITDVWDVQPFKDEFRLPSFRGSKFIHKYLPDLEVFRALGGKPFTLKMSIPTYVNPYMSF